MTPVVRDAQSADFFDGTARGELLLRTCAAGHWSEPPVACCTTCGATDLTWSPSAGTGTVVSWSVVHGRDAGATRVVAIVALAEGPWLWTSLSDVPQPVEGLPVSVAFRRPTEESEVVPYFVAS